MTDERIAVSGIHDSVVMIDANAGSTERCPSCNSQTPTVIACSRCKELYCCAVCKEEVDSKVGALLEPLGETLVEVFPESTSRICPECVASAIINQDAYQLTHLRKLREKLDKHFRFLFEEQWSTDNNPEADDDLVYQMDKNWQICFTQWFSSLGTPKAVEGPQNPLVYRALIQTVDFMLWDAVRRYDHTLSTHSVIGSTHKSTKEVVEILEGRWGLGHVWTRDESRLSRTSEITMEEYGLSRNESHSIRPWRYHADQGRLYYDTLIVYPLRYTFFFSNLMENFDRRELLATGTSQPIFTDENMVQKFDELGWEFAGKERVHLFQYRAPQDGKHFYYDSNSGDEIVEISIFTRRK